MDQPNRHRTRPVIIDALKQAASAVATQRALVLVLRSVKYLLGTLVLLCAADALFHFASGARFGFILGGGGLVAAIGIAAVTITLFARPALLNVAQLLEGRDKSLGSKLTNVLQLEAQAKDESLAPLTRDLARHAVVDSAQHIDPNSLPPLARFPRLKREFKWAIMPVAIFAVLALLLGEPARRQLLRYVDPYGDHPPLSFTLLDISKPDKDGIEVVYGESVRIEATARGHQPKELVLTAAPADGSGPARLIPMSTRGDGSFVVTLENITAPLTLTAETPNKRSRSRHRLLGVLLTPHVEEAWVMASPPAYTGLPSALKPFRFAGLQALEGTAVEFRLRSNRPLGPGRITARPTGSEPFTIPLQPLPEGPANEVRGSFTPTQSGRLTFEVFDIDHRRAETDPSSSLTITRDLPPRVVFLSPVEDSFVVEDFAFSIQISTSDDYGIRTIRLFTGINGDYAEPESITFEGIGPRRHTYAKDINLLELGARSGDKVTFYAEVIDNCPNPNLARTEMRHLEIITEEQYNDALRKESDVAEIAGKYEDLLDRFRDAVDEQRALTGGLEDLRQKAGNGNLTAEEQKELEGLGQEQDALNDRLEEFADEMESFGRDNPVYDFEKDLHDRLKDMGGEVRRSVVQNEWDFHHAGALPKPTTPRPKEQDHKEQDHKEQDHKEQDHKEQDHKEEDPKMQDPDGQPDDQPGDQASDQPGGEGDDPPGKQAGGTPGAAAGGGTSPAPPDPEAMERAAREHLERLGGQQQRGEDSVRKPLEEVAELHELMKDFQQFSQLFREQRLLTDQTAPYKGAENLDAADRMSLEEMAARERGVGQALDQLEDKLRRHADQAAGKFPQAAGSARDLADAMDLASMPGLARNASRSMLEGDGNGSHLRAKLLLEEMGRLFEDAGQPGMANAEAGLDGALRLTHGMNPGNSFNQMMQSLNFNPGQGGAGGAGQMGGMATGGMEGQPKGLMGGESMLPGPIAQSMRGGQGPSHMPGAPGGPTARIDREAREAGPNDSTRETDTPDSQALFQEYESLTNAYFHSLTKP